MGMMLKDGTIRSFRRNDLVGALRALSGTRCLRSVENSLENVNEVTLETCGETFVLRFSFATMELLRSRDWKVVLNMPYGTKYKLTAVRIYETLHCQCFLYGDGEPDCLPVLN